MDNERKGATILGELLHGIAVIFTMAVLAISCAITLTARFFPDDQDLPKLLASNGVGLSFATIFQIAGFSVIISGLRFFLFSEIIFVKMRIIWRTAIFFIMTLLTFSVFAVINEWFPTNDPWAWVGFIVSTLIGFSFGFGLTLLKLKLEGKKYHRLLANYKASRKI